MADKATEIANLISPTITSLGLELLGIDYLPSTGNAVLRIYIDVAAQADVEPRMVAIEDCEAVSREVSALMDVEDPITSAYTLEVSSPGVDRPLFNAAQFARFVGEQVKVTLRLPQDGRRRFQGRIDRVEAETIHVVIEAAAGDQIDIAIAAGNIEKARLVPDWIALGYAPKPDKGRGGKAAKAAKATKK